MGGVEGRAAYVARGQSRSPKGIPHGRSQLRTGGRLFCPLWRAPPLALQSSRRGMKRTGFSVPRRIIIGTKNAPSLVRVCKCPSQ